MQPSRSMLRDVNWKTEMQSEPLNMLVRPAMAMLLFFIAGQGNAVTIFETFNTDPVAAASWVDAGAPGTTFDYNSSGFLDADIVRDASNPARYYTNTGIPYDETQEFWWEMDLRIVSSDDDYQQCLFGVFNSSQADNHHDVVADRFSFDNYLGTNRGNRNDLVAWDSAGAQIALTGAPDSPGIPYGVGVRVKGHYWYEGSQGKAQLVVHEIAPGGFTGNAIMTAGPGPVIGSGKTLAFDSFGLGNRTDGGLRSNTILQVDNMFFSTESENLSPLSPSFPGVLVAGDFEPDGDVDCMDAQFLFARWLDSCSDPLWCSGADIDRSGRVDLPDFALLAANWGYRRQDYAVASLISLDYLEPGRSEKLDLYYPADAPSGARFPAIVIIHGGGWTSGDKADSRELNIAHTLVPQGYVCASINYKLASSGNPSWPVNLKDCKNAVAFLRANADTYHVDVNHIGAIGGSAGGHLVAMLGAVSDPALEPDAPYPGVDTSVQAVVDMYGITDLLTRQYTEPDGTPNGQLKDGTAPTMLGCTRDACPDLWLLASPVNHVDPDDPPVLILHGTADTTVDYNQSIEFAQTLSAAGVENELHLLDGANHSFDLQSSGYDLRDLVTTFFDTHLKQP